MIVGNARYITKLKDGIRRTYCEENSEKPKHEWEYIAGQYRDGVMGVEFILAYTCRNCGAVREIKNNG